MYQGVASPIGDSFSGLLRALRPWILAGTVALAGVFGPGAEVLAREIPSSPGNTVAARELPKEARETIALIREGGPFPYSRDGAVFANREGRLPYAPRGSYREYTVKTPGSRNRGARRIVHSVRGEFYYTADHYRSFRRVLE